MLQRIYHLRYDFTERSGHFLVLNGDPMLTQEDLEPIEAKMLQYNRIPRLLPLVFEEVDLQLSLFYRIDNKKMLAHELTSRLLTERDLHYLLLQIAVALEESKNFMLSPDRFILHERFIFIDDDWNDLSLIYLPLRKVAGKKPVQEELLELTHGIAKAGGLQKEDIRETINFLREEPFQLHRWKSYLQKRYDDHEQGEHRENVLPFSGERERSLQVPQVLQEPPLPEKEAFPWKGNPVHTAGARSEEGRNPGKGIRAGKSRMTFVLMPLIAVALSLLALSGWSRTNWPWTGGGSPVLALFAALFFAVSFFAIKGRKGAQTAADSKGGGKGGGGRGADKVFSFGQADAEPQREGQFQEEDFRFWFADSAADVKADVKEEKDNGLPDFKTVFLSPPQPTVLLDPKDHVRPSQAFLLSYRGNDAVRVHVDRDPFLIGRDENAVQWLETDAQVSRLHLEIRQENGRYWLKDLNSRNGSFLNGEKLIPYKSYELQNGDVIRFADREVTFKIQ